VWAENSLWRLWTMVRHNVVLLARDPGPLLGYTVVPLLLITALRPLYATRGDGSMGTASITCGSLVLFSLISLNIVGHSLLNERSWFTWDRLRATPAATAELLLGKLIPFYLMLLLQQTVLLTYSSLVLGMRFEGSVAALVGIFLTWPTAVLAMGSLCAGLVRTHGQLNTINDIGAFVITIIGGGLTPLSELPRWMHQIAPLSPGYWGVAGYRAGLTSDSGTSSVPPLAVVLLIAAAAAMAAVVVSGRQARLTQQP
jgi:ABC-2 type transport system permease protein